MNKMNKQFSTWLKENPYITQLELAERRLSRPAVANIISGLMRQRYILGKAYVINESPIVCIGAANVDRKFYIDTPLQPKHLILFPPPDPSVVLVGILQKI